MSVVTGEYGPRARRRPARVPAHAADGRRRRGRTRRRAADVVEYPLIGDRWTASGPHEHERREPLPGRSARGTAAASRRRTAGRRRLPRVRPAARRTVPPPGYAAATGYGPPPGYGHRGYRPAYGRPTNTMAILALVLAFVFAPAGLIPGIVARKQIRQTGEDGDGLALAGIIVGGIVTALFVLLIVFWIIAVRLDRERLLGP